MTLYAKRVMALAVAVCATVLAGCGGDPASPQPGALSDPAGLSNDDLLVPPSQMERKEFLR